MATDSPDCHRVRFRTHRTRAMEGTNLASATPNVDEARAVLKRIADGEYCEFFPVPHPPCAACGMMSATIAYGRIRWRGVPDASPQISDR
jgi:hypothetical protein